MLVLLSTYKLNNKTTIRPLCKLLNKTYTNKFMYSTTVLTYSWRFSHQLRLVSGFVPIKGKTSNVAKMSEALDLSDVTKLP